MWANQCTPRARRASSGPPRCTPRPLSSFRHFWAQENCVRLEPDRNKTDMPLRRSEKPRSTKRKAALENQVASSAERRKVINMRQFALSARRKIFTASWKTDLSFGYANAKENVRKATRIFGVSLIKKRESEFVMSATKRIFCL